MLPVSIYPNGLIGSAAAPRKERLPVLKAAQVRSAGSVFFRPFAVASG